MYLLNRLSSLLFFNLLFLYLFSIEKVLHSAASLARAQDECMSMYFYLLLGFSVSWKQKWTSCYLFVCLFATPPPHPPPPHTHTHILANLKSIVLSIMHTKFGQNWVRSLRGDVEYMNFYMFMPKLYMFYTLVGPTVVVIVHVLRYLNI